MAKNIIDAIVLLQNERGELTATAVVEAARDPESVLHGHFEWDDTKAAEAHRLDQARSLIRSVTVQVRLGSLQVAVPAYVRDPGKEGGAEGYRNVAQLRTETDLAREAIVSEFKAVASRLQRARRLAQVLSIPETDIDDIADAVGAIVERVMQAPATPQ